MCHPRQLQPATAQARCNAGLKGLKLSAALPAVLVYGDHKPAKTATLRCKHITGTRKVEGIVRSRDDQGDSGPVIFHLYLA